LVTDPTVTAIAAKYGKTDRQIILRWHMELGVSAVVKSANPTAGREHQRLRLHAERRGQGGDLTSGPRERTAQDSDVEGH